MMIQDDELDVHDVSPERIQALGFKPQKELLINHLLPYADEIDKESSLILDQVKENFAKSVMLREMKPGCGVWSTRLMKYIRMYGMKFSKEDHINFIKLIYELIFIPELEPRKVQKFATIFVMLTKTRHLISADEMTLPWRPLYELKRRVFDSSATHLGTYHYLSPKQSGNKDDIITGMVRKFMSGSGLSDVTDLFGLTPQGTDFPTSLETAVLTMVRAAKSYFEVSATREILAEFLPYINPWSAEILTLNHLVAFLPVDLKPEHAKHGHELWFDDIMDIWDNCYNLTFGASDIMELFAGLAMSNPGAIDWSPHVPKMFMKFLHSLHLPVGYKDMQFSKNLSLNMKHVATWIVWCIKPDGLIFKHLRSFLAAIDSYFQSANQGRWSLKLRDLLKKLCKEFLERVRREREKQLFKCWINQTPDEMRLRDEDITEFVELMVEPTLLAVYTYSSSGSLDISSALLQLGTLRPALVVPRLVGRLTEALDSLTEPHRATASLAALAAVARPLLRGAEAGYPAGPTHAVPLLIAVLPGLDPNDLKKSLVTLQFILLFTWSMPIIDCSSAHLYWPDLTDEELLTCESTAQFEDFVLVFLDRVFVIIESSVTENVRLDTKEADGVRSRYDVAMEAALHSASKAVLMQCSPKILKEALRKFTSFAMNSTFEANVSGKMVGMLLGVFARVDAASTLEAVLPALCGQLLELLPADARGEEIPARRLLYRLVLLQHIVHVDGAALLPYMPLVTPVLDRALKLHATTALTRSCETLGRILVSLSTISLKEWRSSPHDYSTAPEEWLPIREWGRGCLLKDVKLQWHVPNEEEARCCQMLVDRFLEPEVVRLEQWLSGEREMCRDRMARAFLVMMAALAGGGEEATGPGEPLVVSVVPGLPMRPATGERARVLLRGAALRPQVVALLQRVQARLLAERADQARVLELLARSWERVLGLRSAMGNFRTRGLLALERALDAHGGQAERGEHTARLRMLLAEVARLHDATRREMACEADPAPHVLTALHCLFDLALNPYTMVRVLAQARLSGLLSEYAFSYRAIMGRLREALEAGAVTEAGEASEAGEARFKGALYMLLGPRNSPLAAKHDWTLALELWPAVLNSPLSEKPSIISLEHILSETLQHHFSTVNTRLTMPQGAIDAARDLLTEEQLKDEGFVQLLSQSEERERENNEKSEQQYVELACSMSAVLGAAGSAWRRAEMAARLLLNSCSLQTRYPAAVARAALPALLHPDLSVRHVAARLTHFLLKLRKLPLRKVLVDPYQLAGLPRPTERVRGYRKDLEWAMWTDADVLRTDEEWDRPWLKNSNIGFYAWPEKLEVPAPASEQTFLFDIDPKDMEEGQRYIYEFFTNDENIEKLVKFLTAEEKKGKEKFSGARFGMFRTLFANFGEAVADRLLTAALRCASSEQEAPQRFAGEVAAAALRAARHWRREPARAMQQRALAVLSAGLAAVSPETADEWGTALATALANQCPRRVAPVLAALRAQCLPAAAPRELASSFVVCARLNALQGALTSLAWRGAPLAKQILRQLDDDDFTQHPYQNVRETVGSMLMTIFDTQLKLCGSDVDDIPSLEDFLFKLKPRFSALYDENGDIIIKTTASPLQVQCETQIVSSTGSPEREVDLLLIGQVSSPAVEAVRLTPECEEAAVGSGVAMRCGGDAALSGGGAALEAALAGRLEAALRLSGGADTPAGHGDAVALLTTLLRAAMGIVVRAVGHDTRAMYSLVGTACALTTRGTPAPHDELPRAADGFLASLARHHHHRDDIYLALSTLEELADARSWWARVACLQFAQPLFFYGLPVLCSNPDTAERAEQLALKLMRDPRIEVRQSASELLTGLMHCGALPDEDKTLRKLIKLSQNKALVEKHCGVLGLCAYLASRPYSVGSWLGEALAALAAQAGAPDPVPAAIRQALADFRRTHHDDWPRHRAQLTRDELDLLADLTSPPSYFA